MIEYVAYSPEHAADCVAVWNAAMGKTFPMDMALWRQNVDQCPTLDMNGSRLAWENGILRGGVIAKTPRHVGAIFVDPEARRRGIGSELLACAESSLRASGAERFVTGQDDRHFFPGVPEEAVTAQAFFAARGYVAGAGLANDLKRDLRDYVYPGLKPETAAKMQGEAIMLRACETRDVPALYRHLEENFSGRWLHDTQTRVLTEPTPEEIQIAVRNETDVIGFCHTFSPKSRYFGPSIYWRLLMGDAYGGLGPIGVAKDVRKIGLGLALLEFSVDQVKRAGVKTMAIDWTDLVDFYARAGFSVWKQYRAYQK